MSGWSFHSWLKYDSCKGAHDVKWGGTTNGVMEIGNMGKASGFGEKKMGSSCLFTCLTIPGECWSTAWDDHTKYFAVKLSANLVKVGVIPE